MFLYCQVEVPTNNNTPVTASTPAPRDSFLNTILQWKEPGLLGEMADSQDGAWYTHDEPGALHNAKNKEVFKTSK